MKLIVPTTLVNLAKQVMKMGHIPVNLRVLAIPVSLKILAIPVRQRILAIPVEMRMLVILVVTRTLEIPVNYPVRMEDILMNQPTKSADLRKRMLIQINKGHIPVEVKILNNLPAQLRKLHLPKIEETLFVKMTAFLAMNWIAEYSIDVFQMVMVDMTNSHLLVEMALFGMREFKAVITDQK